MSDDNINFQGNSGNLGSRQSSPRLTIFPFGRREAEGESPKTESPSQSSANSPTASFFDNPQKSKDSIKGRIARLTKSHRGGQNAYWVNQEQWEKQRPEPQPETPLVNKHWAAVGLDDSNRLITLYIWSQHLTDAFRIINKVPELNSSLSIVHPDAIIEAKPFRTLFKNMPELQREIENTGNPDALLDLKALETAIEYYADSEWKAASTSLELNDGSVSFDTLWAHLIPGDFVITKDKLGSEWLSIFVDIEFYDKGNFTQRELQRQTKTSDYNIITVWNINWDEGLRAFRRIKIAIKIKSFGGRRPFVSLPVYPLKYRPGDVDKFKKFLGLRGRKWRSLILGKPSKYRSHDGPALAFRTPRLGLNMLSPLVSQMRGRVIRDDKPKNTTQKVRMGLDSDDESDWNKDFWLHPVEDERSEYAWDEIYPEAELTQTQAELCQPVLVCNDVLSGEEHVVSVENVNLVNWNQEALKSLILPKHEKDLLVGLVQHHTSKVRNIRSDLIENKGKGLVILLYGPPGTGKTLTAESIGETVGKPLVPLSIGGLIADESGFENRLRLEFAKATRWDAILLLDEADVLLEARSFEDITRNGIVSSFLRHLEYFEGVLFLTTNKIEKMDDAFQSRISVAIRFKKLNTSTRIEIWKSLLTDRFSREEQWATPEAASNIKRNIEMLAKPHLNGRQIRNVLNVAEGLAFTETQESGHVTLKHIRNALESTTDFEKFFKTGKGKDSSKTTSIWASHSRTKGTKSDDSESESE